MSIPKGYVQKNSRCARNAEVLLQMCKEGKTLQEMSLVSGAMPSSIKQFLERNGIKKDFSWPKNSNVSKNETLLLKMCSENASVAQMAKAVGSSQRSVKAFLVKTNARTDFSRIYNIGELHPNWKGGDHVDKDGYRLVYCPNHPHRRKHTPYMFEHRLVMEKMIGRYLLLQEVVHHRDKNKLNNSPENLQLFSENSVHLASELKGQCPKWTDSGKARIQKLIAQNAEKRRGKILAPPIPGVPTSLRTGRRFVDKPQTTPLSPLEMALTQDKDPALS